MHREATKRLEKIVRIPEVTGPSIGTFNGAVIPGWIEAQGQRLVFERPITIAADGMIDLEQFREGDFIVPPHFVFRAAGGSIG